MRAVLTRDGDYFVDLRERIGARGPRTPTCSCRFTPIRSAIAASPAHRCTCCSVPVPRARRRRCWPSSRTPPISRAASRSRRGSGPVLLDLSQSEIIGAEPGRRPRSQRARSRRRGAQAQVQRGGSWCSSHRIFPRCWSRPPTSPIPPRSAGCARQPAAAPGGGDRHRDGRLFLRIPRTVRASAGTPQHARERRGRLRRRQQLRPHPGAAAAGGLYTCLPRCLSVFSPANSSTRSPPARSSSGPPRWSRSSSKTRSMPARGASRSTSRAAASA